MAGPDLEWNGWTHGMDAQGKVWRNGDRLLCLPKVPLSQHVHEFTSPEALPFWVFIKASVHGHE